MQNFFVTPFQVKEGLIYIEGSDVNHMKNVLRMRVGEQIRVNDGNNGCYLCEIAAYEEKAACLRIVEEICADTELPCRIYLFQGLPKQEKMELIVQKCVELGVYEIIPVFMKRCVVKLDDKKAKKKAERWQEISKSAAKQAGRGIIPRVCEAVPYKEALKRVEELDVALMPYELAEDMGETKKVIESIAPGQSVGIFIGPEGGFDREEAEAAVRAGAKEITLGRRILRTETAGLSILAVLMFHLEGQ